MRDLIWNKWKARRLILTAAWLLIAGVVLAAPRERLLMNFNWQFAYGHASDIEQDFNVGTRYFTYLAKAGYGDGAASEGFDDRTWRRLDLPHDWAVEQGFSCHASHSHGYKTVGHAFPESSVGWYRKTFEVPTEDEGKRIFIEFDGVYRDAKVWVNGFYCGHEPSGYSSFSFDISEYLNYGGENVVAVRADASIEEGWFYEGAGIYRHVWLTKTATTHVPQYGTFITSEVKGDRAEVTARISVTNKATEPSSFQVRNAIVNPQGEVVASQMSELYELGPLHSNEFTMRLPVEHPLLWDLDTPHLYQVVTELLRDGEVVDRYPTTFGIRTIEWTPDRGFFLNGRHVKIKGTNNHQNHAGVGTAIPDALHEWRLQQLKDMGNNAYRTAHYPPTPALLDAADRMGMLILNENRLMGTTDEILDHLRRLMIRDRNHPSVVLWSIGNEEWQIEGNERGAKMAEYMQAYAKQFDTTRPINAAVSGTWGGGISSVVEVMGYNYLRHGSTDAHHAKYPWQASLGTEEGSTNTTRGIYVDDAEKQYLAAYDQDTPTGFYSIQHGWKHYASRDYLSGMVIWTGFDYRGESTPFVYPSVVSYFGMFDLCGLPKDNVYYLKSWWSNEDVLHILPHWTWPDRLGEEMDVWVYSNMDEVELFLNNKSLGRQKMEPNSHLSWKVAYAPGTVKAVGYKDGQVHMQSSVATTDQSSAVNMVADRTTIQGDHEDVSVITVQVVDEKGRIVPDANEEVEFSISGPGRIIGVGNGNPTSHEPDQFLETVTALPLSQWKERDLSEVDITAAVQPSYDAVQWQIAFADGALAPGSESVPRVFRGAFELTETQLKGEIHWMYKSIGNRQSVYVNGHLVGEQLDRGEHTLPLGADLLMEGANVVTIVAHPFVMAHPWDEVNMDPGALKVVIPAEPWQRKTFNGLAQVLVQSTGAAGTIEVKATSDGLSEGRLSIEADASERRAHIK